MEMKNANGITVASTTMLVSENMKSGEAVHLAFSRNNFYAHTFVMTMTEIANIVPVDLWVNALVVVQRTNVSMSTIQPMLSLSAVMIGLWTFLKGGKHLSGE